MKNLGGIIQKAKPKRKGEQDLLATACVVFPLIFLDGTGKSTAVGREKKKKGAEERYSAARVEGEKSVDFP